MRDSGAISLIQLSRSVLLQASDRYLHWERVKNDAFVLISLSLTSLFQMFFLPICLKVKGL